MSGLTTSQLLQAGLEHHKAGRLLEAEDVYRRILLQSPDLADALHLLGVLIHQQGHQEEAFSLIERAIALRPGEAVFHNNLALVLMALSRNDEAITACDRAIELNSQYAEAHHTRGIALIATRRFGEAAESFRRFLAMRPDHADAQFNLGRALVKTGPLDEAIDVCRRAVALRPDRPEGVCNLGVALTKAGRHAEAEICYRDVLRRHPDHIPAMNKLAGLLLITGQFDEAEALCRRVCELEPTRHEAISTLANILRDGGRIDEAIAGYRRSIQLKPEAYADYGSMLYTLHMHPGFDARMIYHEHCLWNVAQARPTELQVQPHENDRSPDRRLRIGYVSPHFRAQATSFFTTPLLREHDHAQFEIYCYSDVLRRDEITAGLQKHADVWRDIVSLPHERVAKMIREDQIDILVDLTMHMSEGRPQLFAQKPAPVQVAWLAYPGTTGLTTMDYRLTDPYLDPPELNDAFYFEKCCRLPDTALCYDPLTTEPPVNSLPASRNGFITFGSPNHFAKANDRVLEMWAKVLAAVPGSRMLVLCPQGNHRNRLKTAVASAGGNPRQIEFLDRVPRAQYLQYFQRIDIVLDTFPYNGETTSLDGLWMGVPMVTLCGTTAPSRAGLSFHHHLGLEDLVAQTPEQYVQIAVGLAKDLPRLTELRSTLRKRLQASPLMDAPRFARNVEAAYRTMWSKWVRQGPPPADAF